jgi:hypothetical protein
MLVLLPVFLLGLSILIILVLHRFRPGFGYSWITATGASLIVWGIILAFYWWRVSPFEIRVWNPALGGQDSMTFVVDEISWPFTFSIASLLLSVMLTDSVRLQKEASVWAWVGSLAIAGTGILTVMAGSMIAVLITWTVMDIIELALVLSSVHNWYWTQRTLLSFSARVGGSMLVLWAMVTSRSTGQALEFGNVIPSVELLLIIGAGLRLGVIPLHLPYIKILHLRRGFGTILRLLTPAISLAFLGRLPALSIFPEWAPILLMLVSLVVLYAAVMWVSAEGSLEGRPFWLVVLAGMAIACVIRGQPFASISWSSTLILSGGIIFLYSAKNERLFFIPSLGAFGLSALPFSLSAGGGQGLFSTPIRIDSILFLISHILLMVGYLRHALKPGESLIGLERWILVLYPFGLILLIATSWFVAVMGWGGSFTIGNWWASGLSVGLAFTMLFGSKRLTKVNLSENKEEKKPIWWLLIMQKVGRFLAGLFRFEWLYLLTSNIYKLVKNLIHFLTTIFEGDAGVLWALLLLALVATLIRFGSGQ